MSEDQNWKVIRKKLEKEPGPGFDQRFWAKFESEFGAVSDQSQRSFRQWFRNLLQPTPVLKWAPILTLLMVAGLIWNAKQPSNDSLIGGPLVLESDEVEMPGEVEMLEQLDWIESVAESEAEIIADASDEEWEKSEEWGSL
jgi:hypothetical protein